MEVLLQDYHEYSNHQPFGSQLYSCEMDWYDNRKSLQKVFKILDLQIIHDKLE